MGTVSSSVRARVPRLLAAPVVVLALALAGCGEDEVSIPDGPAPDGTVSQVVAGEVVGEQVTLTGTAYPVDESSFVLAQDEEAVYVTAARSVPTVPTVPGGAEVQVSGTVQELDDVVATQAIAAMTDAAAAPGLEPEARAAYRSAASDAQSYIFEAQLSSGTAATN